MNSAAGSSAVPSAPSTLPKVEQVLHVRAKSILSCTFGRSAASNRSLVAPPPSYQSVTVGGITSLLHLNSHDGAVRTVGSVEWDPARPENEGAEAPKRGARVTVGEHTCDFTDALRRNKGVSKDLLLRSDVRAVYLPGSDSAAPLHFQRVSMPSGGFPYTVYTIADMSLPPGPTHAHICVGQLTIKQNSKPRSSSQSTTSLRIPFFSTPERPQSQPKPTEGVVVRLELRTRDKAVIDKVVFGSLLVVAGKHPVEADTRVEIDRPTDNEWDAPPALSNLATPSLTPAHSNEHLPLAAPPEYVNSRERLLPSESSQQSLLDADPFGVPGPGPSTIGMVNSSKASNRS